MLGLDGLADRLELATVITIFAHFILITVVTIGIIGNVIISERALWDIEPQIFQGLYSEICITKGAQFLFQFIVIPVGILGYAIICESVSTCLLFR